MHVLVTADTLGGVWTYTRELVSGLTRRGVRVTLVSFGEIPTAKQSEWLTALPEVIRYTVVPAQQALFGKVLVDAEALRMLLFGLALILVMMLRPAGLWPAKVRKREFAR